MFSLFFVFIVAPATLLLRGGAFIILNFSFCVSYIRKMIQKYIFLYKKFAHIKKKQYICIVKQKKQNNN